MNIKRTGLLFCLMIIFLSCRKTKLNKEYTTSQDVYTSFIITEDVIKQIEKSVLLQSDLYSSDNMISGDSLNYCTGFNESTAFNEFPKTIELDYGSRNCNGWDGKNRRGKILSTLSANYFDSISVSNVFFENYFFEDYQCSGNITITNQGSNQFEIVIDNMFITFPENSIEEITINGTITRSFSEGNGTFISFDAQSECYLNTDCYWDDIYSYSGVLTGVNREGRKFDVKITSDIELSFCDKNLSITSGGLDLQPEDLLLRKVNYSPNQCIGSYEVRIKDKTKVVNVPF